MNTKMRLTYTLALLFALSTFLAGCTKEGANGQVLLDGLVVGYTDQYGNSYWGIANDLDPETLPGMVAKGEGTCKKISFGDSHIKGGEFNGYRC